MKRQDGMRRITADEAGLILSIIANVELEAMAEDFPTKREGDAWYRRVERIKEKLNEMVKP